MSKTHIVNVIITNNTDKTLSYDRDWFDSGRLGTNTHWPKTIAAGETVKTYCCEKNSSLAGCSGWVKYKLNGHSLCFAFSNPSSGSNKVGLSTSQKIWNSMDDHYTCMFKQAIELADNEYVISEIRSSSGKTNNAEFVIESYVKPPMSESNPLMNDVEATFDEISEKGQRNYYKSELPIDIDDMINSHFKGVALFNDKLIYSHTNVPLSDSGDSKNRGKYLEAYQVTCGNQGYVDRIYKSQPEGWCHPGGEQVCGSYMAVGIQKGAMDMKESKIQIYDIRNVEVNADIELLGEIERDDAINGCAMTKELGNDGKYIVAGIQDNILTVYKSKCSRLVSDDSGLPFGTGFEEIGAIKMHKTFPGIALATQADGKVYLFGFDGDPGKSNTIYLYQLDIQNIKNISQPLKPIKTKEMLIPGMSDSVKNFKTEVLALSTTAGVLLPPPFNIIGAAGVKQLKKLLNDYEDELSTSFRWGKGLTITSANDVEVYATDRNVLPLFESDKNFSVVTWKSS